MAYSAFVIKKILIKNIFGKILGHMSPSFSCFVGEIDTYIVLTLQSRLSVQAKIGIDRPAKLDDIL